MKAYISDLSLSGDFNFFLALRKSTIKIIFESNNTITDNIIKSFIVLIESFFNINRQLFFTFFCSCFFCNFFCSFSFCHFAPPWLDVRFVVTNILTSFYKSSQLNNMNIDKTLVVKVGGEILVDYKELHPFQGKLKSITKDDYHKLIQSLKKNGLPVPFNIWIDAKGKKWIQDGHHRIMSFKDMETDGWFIPPIPCNIVKAKDKKEAASLLLIANSTYAHMTQESLSDFMIDFELSLPDLEFLDLPDLDMSDFALDDGSPNDGSPDDKKGNMRDTFLYPPFSVINAREGEWQDRKRYWIAMGISSELGRGGEQMSSYKSQDKLSALWHQTKPNSTL